jgi:hypothetical protein
MTRALRAILLALVLIAFMVPCAFAGDLKLHWSIPCYQARRDTCPLDSTTPEHDLRGVHVWLARFSPPDMIDLGIIDEVGRECQQDSALFSIQDGVMGVAIFRSVNQAGKESCIYASYVFAMPASLAPSTQPGLLAEYFGNKTLSLPVALARVDGVVDFDWALGSPGAPIPADNFSVRWSGFIAASHSETYTIYATSDDGMRVFIDDAPIVTSWMDQGATEHSGTTVLSAGSHRLRVEFYESGGAAVSHLSWSSASQAKQIVPASALSH